MDRVIGIIVRVIVWLAKYTAVLSKAGIGEYEEWKKGEKIKFLLIGYNGARNTGADARVVAMVEQIENLFGKEQVEISVMTLDKETMKGYFHENIRLIQFSSIFLGEIYRECSRHHVAVLCEGSTLKSTFANALTMCFCEAAGIMKNQHKPCIAYGSEVGEMDVYLQKMAHELCDDTYFIVRTEESYGRLEELGLHGHVGTDTAWTFSAKQQYEWAREELKMSGRNGEEPVLGVAVMNPFWWPVKPSLLKWIKASITHDHSLQFNKWYFFSDSEERRAMYERYIRQIAEGINRFCSNRDVHVAIIGMERLDEKACEKLKSMLEQPCSMFVSGRCTVFEMSAVLRNLSYLVTSRYHAAVLSMEGSVPISAISMDERLDSLMKEVSLEKSFLHSVRDIDLGKRVYRSLCTMEAQKEDIQHRIESKKIYYNHTLEQMGSFLKKYVEEKL